MATVKTFLSPYVHYIVCELVNTSQYAEISGDMEQFGSEKMLQYLSDALQENHLETKEDFTDAVKVVLPFAKKIAHAQDKACVTDLNHDFYEWLSAYKSFPKEMVTLTSSDDEMMLFLLKLTATLERALGDIYALSGMACPFLLRDLLATDELKSLFGAAKMKLMKVLMGSPLGLNLRNLAWHGFLSPSEIPQSVYTYISLLLFISNAMASDVLRKFSISSIYQRPVITESSAMKLLAEQFQWTSCFQQDDLLQHFEQSSIMSPLFEQYIHGVMSLYERGRYADCVIMLLPCLENVLRSVFAISNNCEHRVLTAESAVLYTTLDEVLSQFMEDGRENEIRKVLGDNMMILLLDLFFMPDGPRLRDRLSHGEMAPEVLSKPIACLVLCVTSYLSFASEEWSLSPGASGPDLYAVNPVVPTSIIPCAKLSENISVIFSTFREKLCNYESLFHPLAITKRAWQECGEKISEFELIPCPEEFRCLTQLPAHGEETSGLSYASDSKTSSEAGAEDTSLKRSICPLFLGKSELEVIVALRHIAEECLTACANIVSFLRDRWQSYRNHSLRSRARANYKRLIVGLPAIKSLLEDILKIISRYLLFGDDEVEKWYNPTLRRLKSVVKVSENLRTMTVLNKWSEASRLSLQSGPA